MFWYIVKYVLVKAVSGHTLSDIKVIKQEVLKEQTQCSKLHNYPIETNAPKKYSGAYATKFSQCEIQRTGIKALQES